MKTYSLLQFLSEPVSHILDSSEEYAFRSISPTAFTVENSDAVSKIIIPVIQRDYAQGREENKVMRGEFIGSMFSSLETGEQLKLDFVYGTLQRIPGGTRFLPLDGQQRLTTLFLLHWYIIKKEIPEDAEDEILYKNLLSKFSYETRDTSRRFFAELINFKHAGNSIVKEIIDSYWFSDHFKLDPTVSGILNTLETIENFYQKSEKKGSILESLLKGGIVFYVLPMDRFKLTDDLYIKLNARGKILSPFENFKADFIGFIKKQLELSSSMTLSNGITMPHYDYIGNKFDNDWSNLFWSEIRTKGKGRENKIPAESLDAYFFRFIHRLFINNYILDYIGIDINKDTVYRELLSKEADQKYSTFDFYIKNRLIHSTGVMEMEILLDFYLKNFTSIRGLIMPLWDMETKWDIYSEKYTMTDRMLFDAVNQYILNNAQAELNQKRFSEWIRIVWNLISDPDIRSIEANKTVMHVIRSIAVYSGRINAALADGTLDEYMGSLKNIHHSQLQEEKQKAVLMAGTNAILWEQEIYKAETHKLWEGNIGFLLQGSHNPQQLADRYSIAGKIFDSKRPFGLVKEQEHALMRYVIASHVSYDELKVFNFSDNEINWKTYLRRNNSVKDIISKLLSCSCMEKVHSQIRQVLLNESGLINANSKEKKAHKNLYSNNIFHSWMQNDGVNKLRWREEHIYAFRQSAWYSKVMIDGCRNELTQALIDRFGLEQPNFRCSSSNYFMGEHYELFLNLGEMRVSFYFDIKNYLHLGLWSGYNPKLALERNVKDAWIEVHTFGIDNISSSDDVSRFIKAVEQKITGAEMESLLVSMFKMSN
jgi:hypothetical protein